MGGVNDDHQNNPTEDADQGALQIDCNHAKEPEEKAMTVMMILACTAGSVLILKANFITEASGEREKGRIGLEGECWRKCSRERKEQWLITMAL